MSGFDLAGKRFLVTGVANKKSVAWQTAKRLEDEGAEVIFTVRSEARAETTAKLLAGREVHVCDVEHQDQIEALAAALGERSLDGLVHSIAFANYEEGMKPFHETQRADFLQAVDISCFSLVALARALEANLSAEGGASVVTISISTTTMAAENYGIMAPIKAALDSAVVFLAKSFGERAVRFNAVRAGLLKTSASAGIPGYLESYLFAEGATFRGSGLSTGEVADTALFLLSPRSSGINGQGIVVDAGMGSGYFDRALVERATRIER
ncbi:MAG: SDR family oxidoreductase [Planctomycetota bacterium]|nr:SDR family oxidoreductase [Planctomycetota bacterium]